MAREKKITVRPYLNKVLKAVGMESDGEQYFPLYFRVTYMRRVTKFPVSNIHVAASKEDSLLEVETVAEFAQRITQIVEFEIERNPNFTVKGLGRKVKSYFSVLPNGVGSILRAYLKGKGLNEGGTGDGFYTERIGLGMVLKEKEVSVAATELTYILFALSKYVPVLTIYDFLFQDQSDDLKLMKEQLLLADNPGVVEDRFVLQKYLDRGAGKADLEKTLRSVCFFLIANNYHQLVDLEVNVIDYDSFGGLVIE